MKLLIPGTDRSGDSPAGQPLSALEEALRGDNAAAAQAALAQSLTALDSIDQRLRQRSAQGLPPAEYAVLASLQDACQAARETLTLHKRQP